MKNEGLIYAAAAVVCVGWLFTPGKTHAAKGRNLNINTQGDAAIIAGGRLCKGGAGRLRRGVVAYAFVSSAYRATWKSVEPNSNCRAVSRLK